MHWFRIDNRLVHGQVIEAWLPYIRAKILLVANDELAHDMLRQEIMSLAVPSGIFFSCCTVDKTGEELKRLEAKNTGQRALVLFANCADARSAHQSGVEFSSLNIGNLHYGPGKEQICEHIALGTEDKKCLCYFEAHQVELDLRCVPTRPVKVAL